MSLSSISNTINALGIFGRLEPSQEKYFKEISDKYSKYPEDDDSIGIFNHLSLVINRDVPVGKMPGYLDLLKELKNVKEMVFYDFILVANRQNDENTIYSSNRYK